MRAQRATPRIGGKAKERKPGRPQRPKIKAGADFVRLLRCLTSEDMERRERDTMQDHVPSSPACPGESRDTSRSLLRGLPTGIKDQHITHRAMQRCRHADLGA